MIIQNWKSSWDTNVLGPTQVKSQLKYRLFSQPSVLDFGFFLTEPSPHFTRSYGTIGKKLYTLASHTTARGIVNQSHYMLMSKETPLIAKSISPKVTMKGVRNLELGVKVVTTMLVILS